MNTVNKISFQINQYITSANVYQLAFTVAAFVIFGAVSIFSKNATVETWASVLFGFSVGLLLIKMPAIIAIVKKGKQDA